MGPVQHTQDMWQSDEGGHQFDKLTLSLLNQFEAHSHERVAELDQSQTWKHLLGAQQRVYNGG